MNATGLGDSVGTLVGGAAVGTQVVVAAGRGVNVGDGVFVGFGVLVVGGVGVNVGDTGAPVEITMATSA